MASQEEALGNSSKAIRTDIGVPGGSYLKPATTSTEGGRSYISRSGFKQLAHSDVFVNNLERDVAVLLCAFVDDWAARKSQNGDLSNQTIPSDSNGSARHDYQEHSAAESPYQVFSGAFQRLGWQYVQTTWSEHEPTRLEMYRAVVRAFVDHLRPLTKRHAGLTGQTTKEAYSEQRSNQEVLRAIGALFALYIVQSTSILKNDDRWTSTPSGRVEIEADTFQALHHLPELARSCMDDRDSTCDLRPSDDVEHILACMLGENADETGGASVFDVLPSSEYGIRRPQITNHLSTRAEKDRQEGVYGTLRSASQSGEIGLDGNLSRAQLIHSLLRQRMALPLYVPRQRTADEESNAEFELRDQPPDSIVGIAAVVGRRGASRVGAGLPPRTDALQKYQASLEKLAQTRARYEACYRKMCDDDEAFADRDSEDQMQVQSFRADIHPQSDLELRARGGRGYQPEVTSAPDASHSTPHSREPRRPIWRSRTPIAKRDILCDARAQTQKTMRRTMREQG